MKEKKLTSGVLISILYIAFSFCFSGHVSANNILFFTDKQADTIVMKPDLEFFLRSPSSWIQNNINKLNSLTLTHIAQLDTTAIQNKLKQIAFSGEMIKQNLEINLSSWRLRYLVDLQSQLKIDINDLIELQGEIARNNNYLTSQALICGQVEDEIEYFNLYADSSIKQIYNSEIGLLRSALIKTNNYFSSRLINQVKLEHSVNTVALSLQENSKYTQNLITEKEASQYKPNLPPIWKASPEVYTGTFKETMVNSYKQSLNSMKFFLEHGSFMQIIYRLILFVICLIPVHYFKKASKINFGSQQTNKFLQKYPNSASAVMGLAIAPVIFTNAPSVLLDLIFICLTLVVGYIYIKEHAYVSKKAFYTLLTFYIILRIINFLITPTFNGRLVYSIAILILIPMFILYRDFKRNPNMNKNISGIVFILLALQMSAGWVLSLFGYYALGRSFFLSALNAFIIALVLYVTVLTFVDYLRIITLVINKRVKSFQLNKVIIEKYNLRFAVMIAVIWFVISYFKDINVYDKIWSGLTAWINAPRQFGDSSFKFNSIIIFLVSIAAAIFVSALVNKAIDTKDNSKHYKTRSSIGSYKLLIRFVLICTGFLLGIRASGIPLNKITIVMGALGVGIGFGLQSIFNNLVSGLIIAIEKPISVGDMIEVEKEIGWVRSIGIRSSNIQTVDGAEVIVPNGELISRKLINWTLSDQKQRIEIKIGVAYKSDPHFVNELLSKIITDNPEVLKKPEPFIYFTGMGDNSLEFAIFFWIDDIVEGKRIKSDILLHVFDIMKKNDIEIPFPQRDLHLKSVEPGLIIQSPGLKKK